MRVPLSSDQAALLQVLQRVPELEAAYWAFLEEERQCRPYAFGVVLADFLLEVAQSLLSHEGRWSEPEELLNRFLGVCAEQLAAPDPERGTFIVTGVFDYLDEQHPAYGAVLRPRLQEVFPAGDW